MSEVDWEARYQQSDTPWDKGLAHPALASFVSEFAVNGTIVVPGCGRAYDLLALAECFPDHQIIGVDLSASAIRDANKICASHANISLRHADFFDCPAWHRGETIGMIWEHTCFCAIPPRLRPEYVATVTALLSAGSHLLGAFFTDLDDEGCGPPWNCSLEELSAWFAPHFTIIHECADHPTHPVRVGEERLVAFQRLDSLD